MAQTSFSYALLLLGKAVGQNAENRCGTIFPVLVNRPASPVMNTVEVNQALLQLLVRVYNQSIQSYYFFPDVIFCGPHRLERNDFECLLAEGLIFPYYTDSFGKLYHLTKKAEEVLREQRFRKRYRPRRPAGVLQTDFSFC